jgi:restriction system protein
MIPDFQTIMLPLLKKLNDKEEHHFRDLIEVLAEEFKLNEDERKELLPSGQQPIFDNRVGWARTYLKKAGLIDSPKRGISKITNRGIDVLKQNPKELNLQLLMSGQNLSEVV